MLWAMTDNLNNTLKKMWLPYPLDKKKNVSSNYLFYLDSMNKIIRHIHKVPVKNTSFLIRFASTNVQTLPHKPRSFESYSQTLS